MTKQFKGLIGRFHTTESIMNETLRVRDDDSFAARVLNLQATSNLVSARPLVNDISSVIATTASSVTIGTGDDSYTKDVPHLAWLPCPTSESPVLDADAKNAIIAHLPFSVDPTMQDEGASSVAVGGSFTGNIDFSGDTDLITVSLTAGQTYMISLRSNGATPLSDTYLLVNTPTGTVVNHDDDGGIGTNSILTFTAAVTGDYQIIAEAFPGDPSTGGYIVDVRQRGSDSVGNTNATAVDLAEGVTFGFRETGTGAQGQGSGFNGDSDRYHVHLEAGKFYTFQVGAGADYETNYLAVPNFEIDTYLRLRNAAGTIVAFNDDNDFPDDISSGIGFYATTTGEYYLDVFGYSGNAAGRNTGGYALEFHNVDLSTLNPLDSINWDSADNVEFDNTNTAYVYFAVAGESFGELADDGVSPLPSFGWNDYEKGQVMMMLEEYSKVLGTHYVVTTNSAVANFRLIVTTSTQYGAYFHPNDPADGTQVGIGAFNRDNLGWDTSPANNGLDQGGYGFGTLLHEFGHGHGLSHPHDHGGGSEIMAGVTGSTGSYGVFNLNQQVYTNMSYNDGWPLNPDGAIASNGLPAGSIADAGFQGTLSPLDIAQLQIRYNIHPDYATGDDTYTLKDVNGVGTFYSTIYDTGGNDTIAYVGTRAAQIDLTAATLDYSPTGGGVVSFVHNLPGETTSQNIKGGFTIANGTVVENATGGSGNDVLIGNSAANVLTGNDGNDTMIGRGGNDTIHGGIGTDTVNYDGVRADYTITPSLDANGHIVFTIVDNNTTAPTASGNPIVVADEGTDTLDGVESLHFSDATVSINGTVILYNASHAFVGMYTTIQAAVDAASDGYSILAAAGTYTENVTIDVDITISGVNAGIDGTGVRGPETIINGQVHVTAAGATVDGVEITGDAAAGGFFAGVNVEANNFTLTNSILSGRDGDFSDDTVAVLAGSVTGLDIGNNLITGYLRGVYLFSAVTAGSVHDNLFQGAGSPNPSFEGMGNGINTETQLVTIEDNIFDGIWAGVVNTAPTGTNPADVATYILNNIYNDVGERPIQIYPTNSVHEIYGTDENEAFSADIAVSDNGVTSASFTFHGRGGDDHLYGDEQGDFLYGDDGNDRLFGKGGNDDLTGGTGSDLIDGGAGLDTARVSGTASTFIDTVIGWAVTSGDGNDFLQNVEALVDGSHRNLLVGSTGLGTIQAAMDLTGTGDIVRLASGSYSGSVSYDEDGLRVIAQAGAVQNVTYTTASAFGIWVSGGASVDHITTGANADVLDGGASADFLTGGDGSDTYFVDAGDTIVETATGGTFDYAVARTSYTLGAGVYVELLGTTDNAGFANLNLTGNELAQIIIGNEGANTLDGGGGAGADSLAGFGGNDTYFVDANDTVIEAVGGGAHDYVVARTSYTLSAGAEVELLGTTDNAGTGAINLTGNELSQVIIGNAGANVLDGGSGGADHLAGFGGDDTYFIDADDVILEDVGGGHDYAVARTSYALSAGAEVELLGTTDNNGSAAINLTGNEFANILIGNNGANVLNGGLGADRMEGFGGADSFAFTTALGGGNIDVIADFAHGTDKILLDHSIFGGIGSVGGLGTLFATDFVNGSTALDADDHILYNITTGALYYDADGNGAGAAVQFATIETGAVLTASDFQVI